jgi:hypothetical protein
MARRYDKGQGQVRLSQELSGFLGKNISEGQQGAFKLQSAWVQVCNQQALDHTDNVLFSKRSQGRVVLVYVDSSHWAAELSMNKELLRLKLNQVLEAQIDDIVFEVSRAAALKRQFKKQAPAGQDKHGLVEPIALTLEEEGHARESLDEIADTQLRERLFRAMKADLEWKKGIECVKSPQAAPESPESTQKP